MYGDAIIAPAHALCRIYALADALRRAIVGPEKAATGHAFNVAADSDAPTANATVHSTHATCS